jgi:hypothetical protein
MQEIIGLSPADLQFCTLNLFIFFAFLCWQEMLEQNAIMYLGLTLLFAAVVINSAAPLQNQAWALGTWRSKALAGDSDFMAGSGNRVGPVQDVRHQLPGDGKQE